MKLRRDAGNQTAIVFEEIEPFFLGLLHRIPSSADPGDHPAALERLFGDPIAEDQEDEDDFNEDWRSLVEPEIRELFQTAAQIVTGDLKTLPPGSPDHQSGGYVFDPTLFVASDQVFALPRQHIDAWMTTLNQARLVIAAQQQFGEREMDEDMQFPPLSERDLCLFQIHFYDFLQQVLLRELGFD